VTRCLSEQQRRARRYARTAPKSLLVAVARQQLTLAQNATMGRSMQAVCDSVAGPLTHLVVALTRGQVLGPEATAQCAAWTFQVLQGRVCLTIGRVRRYGWPGELLAGPAGHYQLVAERDAVLLLTLAQTASCSAK
jgi:hypothetical protein